MGTSWQEEEEEEEEDAPQQEPPKEDKLMLRSPGLVYGTRSYVGLFLVVQTTHPLI